MAPFNFSLYKVNIHMCSSLCCRRSWFVHEQHLQIHFFLLCSPGVLLLPSAETHKVLLCSTVLFHNLTYKLFFLPLKSMKKHTTTPNPSLPDSNMAKAPIDMDVEGYFLHFIILSECWLSQKFPTLTYAQRKPSPST